jgi:capsular polysaccharide biosynthesis protein
MPTWGSNHVYNPWLGQQTDKVLSSQLRSAKADFVSRRLKSIFRALDNLTELGRDRGPEGLTILYPEITLERQIALFRNAETVVGDRQRAAPTRCSRRRGTLVIALNWINACQSRIARLKKHRIGYLLPTSAAEVVFSFDAPLQHYAIDPDGFRAKLREAMGQDARPLI